MVYWGEVDLSRPIFKPYTFTDYASQAYSGIAAAAILFFHNSTVPHWPWLVAAHGVGILTVHWMVVSYSRATLGRLFRFLRHFYPVLLYIWFYSETGSLNRMFFKTYQDPVVIRWDQALFGFQPSIVWMQKVPYLPLSEIFYAAYFSYYLMIFGVGLALFLRNRRQFLHYIAVVSFVFYICYVIYIAVPVIGPLTFLHLVPGYSLPADLQALAPATGYPDAVRRGVFFRIMDCIYRVFESPGAAIPSSHVAIALCIVFFCFRYLRPLRYVLLLDAVLLCFSTVYCRYHYATDVLAGLATAAVLFPLGNWLYFKFETQQEPAQITTAIPALEEG